MSPAKRAITQVVPIYEEVPGNGLDPVRLFEAVSKVGKPAFLFEKADDELAVPLQSIIGFDPVEELLFRDGKLTVDSFGKKEVLEGDPFELIQERLSLYQSTEALRFPFISAGGVGYFGYDCVKYLEKIELPPATDPKQAEAHFFVFRNYLIFNHRTRQITLLTQAFPEDGSKTVAVEAAKRRLKQLKDKIFNIKVGEDPGVRARVKKIPIETSLGAREFGAGVSRIHRYIKEGDIFQCVLSEQFRLPVTRPAIEVYKNLRAMGSSPYLYYLSMGKEIIVGASPETLIRYEKGMVSTFPIAGTRPRGKTLKEDRALEKNLLASPKEKAEHLMLVDLGRNDLGRVCEPGTVELKQFMQVQRFSHVMHLVSTVHGKLKRTLSAWDALAACFPAGTLTGAPKIRAMQIISELEPTRRGLYGGAIVAFDFEGRLDACIAIRTLVLRDGIATVQAGAGVVADSKAAREYEEIENKAKAIITAIRLAEVAP